MEDGKEETELQQLQRRSREQRRLEKKEAKKAAKYQAKVEAKKRAKAKELERRRRIQGVDDIAIVEKSDVADPGK